MPVGTVADWALHRLTGAGTASVTEAETQWLGPYEILALLGAGGMGEVYRARDTRLERDVAVKVLPESLVQDSDALARFEREAKAVAALSHPNILAIHDFGGDERTPYAVMELLEGETLRDKLAVAVPQRKALDYALQIAQGLAAAHERGIVHRDLKPENIFVTRDGLVKILDFGLAQEYGAARKARPDQRCDGARHDSRHGRLHVAGAGARAPADHRSDLFSFGAILYEMLSGQRAFQEDSDVETLMAILRDQPPELSGPGHPVAGEIAEIVAHCLEKSPRSASSRRATSPSRSGSPSARARSPAGRTAARARRWGRPPPMPRRPRSPSSRSAT